MFSQGIPFYYLQERHSDLEVVMYGLFEIAFYHILRANGGDESDLADFQLAASKAMEIINNASEELERQRSKNSVELDEAWSR